MRRSAPIQPGARPKTERARDCGHAVSCQSGQQCTACLQLPTVVVVVVSSANTPVLARAGTARAWW